MSGDPYERVTPHFPYRGHNSQVENHYSRWSFGNHRLWVYNSSLNKSIQLCAWVLPSANELKFGLQVEWCVVLKEFYICYLNVQLKIFYWQIFVKTVEEKELISETPRIDLASRSHSALKRNCGASQAQSCLSWPTFSSHGEAVLGRDAEMICLFPLCGKEKKVSDCSVVTQRL